MPRGTRPPSAQPRKPKERPEIADSGAKRTPSTSRQSLSNFEAELENILGWYPFGAEIYLAHPDKGKGYPQDLIVEHESTHLRLTWSSLYGSMILLLGTILDNARDQSIEVPLRDSAEIFHTIVGACFLVQEGIATYSELMNCAVVHRPHLQNALTHLPPDYLESLHYAEAAFGSVKERDLTVELALLNTQIATTIVRCTLDSPELERFKNPESLTLANVSDYLSKDSPDRRFVSVCNSIAKQSAGATLRKIWTDLATQAATKAGIPFQMTGDHIRYQQLTPETLQKLVYAVQPPFLQRVANLGHFRFSWTASNRHRLSLTNSLVKGWRTFLKKRGLSKLMPRISLLKGPGDYWKKIRRVHLLRGALPESLVASKPVTKMERIVLWAIDHVKLGLVPFVSIEQSEKGTVIAVCHLFEPPKQRTDSSYAVASGPQIVRLELEDVQRFEYSGRLYLFDETANYEAIVWHFQGPLLEDTIRSPGIVNAISGKFLVSWGHFSFAHINRIIQALLKDGWPVTIRFLGFYESSMKFVVVHAYGGRGYTSWPTSGEDYGRLAAHYNGHKKVFVGRDAIEKGLGPPEDDTDFVCTLLATAHESY